MKKLEVNLRIWKIEGVGPSIYSTECTTYMSKSVHLFDRMYNLYRLTTFDNLYMYFKMSYDPFFTTRRICSPNMRLEDKVTSKNRNGSCQQMYTLYAVTNHIRPSIRPNVQLIYFWSRPIFGHDPFWSRPT